MNHLYDMSNTMATSGTGTTCLEYLQILTAQDTTKISKKRKKELGQYMTPSQTASYMAKNLLEGNLKREIKILEPSIGSGFLLAAIADEVLAKHRSLEKLSVTAFEVDTRLISTILQLEAYISKKFSESNIKFSLFLNIEDFLLSNPNHKYDYIITNPPFFKVKKNDPRATVHKDIVHGQPNIYGLFMARCSSQLMPLGRACFLTPRSWTSGLYFTKLRQKLFSLLKIYAIHLFECREAPFSNERIQQESMITWFEKSNEPREKIALSFSNGALDIGQGICRLADPEEVLPPTETCTLVIGRKKRSFPQNLDLTLLDIGLKTSTGKVVPFRCKESLRSAETQSTAPLYWMQHVLPMKLYWPANIKLEHIEVSSKTLKLSVPADNYVLVRRFSPNDLDNHVIATPLIQLGAERVYIENHINYIYKTDSSLTSFEAIGLAIYINSQLVCDYFSERLGHTQINASDLNNLPCPTLEVLSQIGFLHSNNKNLCLETLLS